MNIRQWWYLHKWSLFWGIVATIVWMLAGFMIVVAINNSYGKQSPEPPHPPLSVVGKWTMRISGQEWKDTVFQKGGGYQCANYKGYWKMEGSILVITETCDPTGNSIMVWKILLLSDTRRSSPNSTVEFALE